MFLRGLRNERSEVSSKLRCKCEDITATAAARIVGVNRNTVNTYYNRIRELIFEESLKEAGKEFGEFECDESYFGARCVRGKKHVNGIENFWSFAKGRLAKFHGCDSGKFALHLKECDSQRSF